MFQTLLKNYRKKLVNLSSNNRSLLLLRLSKENDCDLNETDFLLQKPSFQLIENLIACKKKFPICPVVDSRDEQANRFGKQLQRLARKDRFLFEESGSRDLYVGWPFVRGKYSDGSFVRCPLLFFPVSLQSENNSWYIVQRNDEPISFNKIFLLAWQHYNQLPLREEFVETSFEGFSHDAREFRTQLYELIKQHGLEINFNSELFVDKLIPFKEFKKVDFESEAQDGKLKLFNEAVLGIFPQAGSYLVPDYDALIAQQEIAEHSQVSTRVETIEAFFNAKTDVSRKGLAIKESDIHAPFALDASQENALRQIKSGQSLVVQGPPGTGKSQLICNLVSDYIGRGKRVVVVCQKRAALDVVFKRLQSAGLGDFVALVHDFKTDRSSIYEKIASQIDKLDEFKQQNKGLDTIFLERNYLEACRRIDQSVAQLVDFKKALFDCQEYGISVKELYLQRDSTHIANAYHLPKTIGQYFSYESLTSFCQHLKFLLPLALQFDVPKYAWYNRNSFAQYRNQDKNKLTDALKDIQSFRLSMKQLIDDRQWDMPLLWNSKSHLPFLKDLVKILREVSSGAHFPDLFYTHFQKFVSKVEDDKKRKKYEKSISLWKSEMEVLLTKKLAIGVNAQNVADYLGKVGKVKPLMKNMWGKLKWRYLSKERKDILALLLQNQLLETAEELDEMHDRLCNSNIFFQLKQALQESKDFEFGEEAQPLAYYEKLLHIEKAIQFSLGWSKNALPILLSNHILKQFEQTLTTFISSIEKVGECYNTHLEMFPIAHLYVLTSSEEKCNEAYQALQKDFDAMVEYDQALEKLHPTEKEALNEILFQGQNTDYTSLSTQEQAANLINSFRTWVIHGWIEEIESKYPVLRVVSTPTIDFLEQQLKSGMAEKQGFSREILLLKLREQVYRQEEFNRLGNRVTFRDLHHQATKKKKIWPLRKTLEAYHEEVFQLMPCWLASPETVSAVFPMKELFDLVIFDEASQCFSEKGIPAMARGMQILMAGDSKQLQPSDLYRARFQDEEEDLPELEIDSLLELGVRHLPQVMLTEHYRSRSLDLIDFSNRHFYQNRLRLLPDFHSFQSGTVGIQFVKTDGYFENQCNLAEAEKVVQICLSLFQNEPQKEVGVITFNIHQQNLIQDLLEEQGVPLPVHLFVKNIENIQGDERDIIIFSIGYAPDRLGRMHHQFGTLNQAGGENRLNVAVSRARERVVVVSSIYPAQLAVENTLHPGPKLLKAYLAYALDVSKGQFVPSLSHENSFSPAWYLKRKIMNSNPLVSEELPFADLTVKDEQGKVTGLVLTDDDIFFHGLSVKETFHYLPQSLEAKKWKFERYWSRNHSLGL